MVDYDYHCARNMMTLVAHTLVVVDVILNVLGMQAVVDVMCRLIVADCQTQQQNH